MKSKLMLCVRNTKSEDLEPRKLYEILPDRAAERDGYLRVVDESGEDYLYPAEFFISVKLPATVTRELVSASPLKSRPRAVRG